MVYETDVWAVVAEEIVSAVPPNGDYVLGMIRTPVVNVDGNSVTCSRTTLPFDVDIDYSRLYHFYIQRALISASEDVVVWEIGSIAAYRMLQEQ